MVVWLSKLDSNGRRRLAGSQLEPGSLGLHVDGYRAWLQALGYTPSMVKVKLTELCHLGRWMASEEIDVERLGSEAIGAFLAAAGLRRSHSVVREGAFRPLLAYLASEGINACGAPRRPLSALGALIEDYRGWLDGRALSPRTVDRYVKLAERFLAQRVLPDGELDVIGLAGADVTRFLLGESARLSLGSTKGCVGELRCLLRFLHGRGLTALALADSVPSVAGWREGGLPEVMARADVERLLSSCDRSNLIGLRDRAILVLLARLGLRSVEVARLSLEDLHWRAGEITIHGKARQRARLPMQSEIGEALAAYITRCDRGTAREVFLTRNAPIRPIRPDLVGKVVRAACQRAGVPVVSPHRLRHSLASEMLRQGASLIDISQVLRHRDLATTAHYAKVDLPRLRQVARAWPGTVR